MRIGFLETLSLFTQVSFTLRLVFLAAVITCWSSAWR
jgi:hypothetical protein